MKKLMQILSFLTTVVLAVPWNKIVPNVKKPSGKALKCLLLCLGLVFWGVGCSTFRGLDLGLSVTSGPSLTLQMGVSCVGETNSAVKPP